MVRAVVTQGYKSGKDIKKKIKTKNCLHLSHGATGPKVFFFFSKGKSTTKLILKIAE